MSLPGEGSDVASATVAKKAAKGEYGPPAHNLTSLGAGRAFHSIEFIISIPLLMIHT